jgi:hypothetical protein
MLSLRSESRGKSRKTRSSVHGAAAPGVEPTSLWVEQRIATYGHLFPRGDDSAEAEAALLS